MAAVVRAWDNQGGAISNWDQVLASSSTARGESVPFTVANLGDGSNFPALTDGLRSFNLYFGGGVFISAQPQDLIVPAGSNAQMRVGVASSVGPSFQWQRESADISGATNSTLAFSNVQYTDAGGYRVLVSVPSITRTSQVARLSVQPKIADISYLFIPEWGANAVRLSYDSTPLRPVRVEVRSTLLDAWINMGQYVNPNVRNHFFDIGPTNDMRLYRLSLDP